MQEGVVAWVGLDFEAILQAAAAQVPYVFEGAHLRVLPPSQARSWPERGRTPRGYGAYYPGPPRPRYLLLEHPDLGEAQELRLAALFMEHLLAALRGAGYRAELERQALEEGLAGFSYSVGYARADEARGEELYRLADGRMYQHKAQRKGLQPLNP